MRGAMEASVAELLDGELVLSLRTQLGAVFLSRSYDGGQHWSLPADDGPALARVVHLPARPPLALAL